MKFTPNTPLASRTPTVVVDAGMAPGSYLFRLEVEDESGNKSRPDERVVLIEREIIIPTKQADKNSASEGNDEKDFSLPGKSERDKAKKQGRVFKTKADVAGKKVGDDDEPS